MSREYHCQLTFFKNPLNKYSGRPGSIESGLLRPGYQEVSQRHRQGEMGKKVGYDHAWSELNLRLREMEAGSGGLAAVLAELEIHQRETGFIKDDLAGVERHVFRHPENPDRFFRVQYNPKRALRFNGSGVATPPAGATHVNGGCFLCRENIRWQQQDAQVGFEIRTTGDEYHAWMNPFPLLPNHVVVAAHEHVTQEWDMDGTGGVDLARLLFDLCGTAKRIPGHVGFYNGFEAGASIPGHLHFQFFRRPEGDPAFPLESWAFEAPAVGHAPMWARGYPLPVARWQGDVGEVVDEATAWIKRWVDGNRSRIDGLSSNFIAAANGHEGAVALYFVPRDRAKPRWSAVDGLVGGLEILGELVVSSDASRTLLNSGVIDYFYVENALASVRTPVFVD
jgi:diadenosine tetraphosphate (Ap4A) HIT family hydrolase